MSLELDPGISDWAYEQGPRPAKGSCRFRARETGSGPCALGELSIASRPTSTSAGASTRKCWPTWTETEEAVQVYANLQNKSGDLQISFAMVFAVVALLLLLAAVWVGLASPIS